MLRCDYTSFSESKLVLMLLNALRQIVSLFSFKGLLFMFKVNLPVRLGKAILEYLLNTQRKCYRAIGYDKFRH